MADRTSDRHPVEALAEQFAREHRQGQQPSIDEYARRFPQFAREIRELFPALVVMEELAPSGKTQPGGETLTSTAPPEAFGDYRIVRELGRGGMGVVYEAMQQSLERRVALKILPFHALGDADRRERFEREAHAAARLDHSHIVPVYEVGEHDGYPFFSMKLIEGTTLADRLAAGPLPPRQTAELLLPVCRAIEAAHQRGVLHRDLKPSNILLDADGQPQVTDFGLAKLFHVGGDVSETNAAAGTPSYMAPEQAQGVWRQIGVRTDVYGLGAILYHCLAARPPFQAATAAETMRQVAGEEPVALRQLNTSIDRDLETICLKCLAKEPAARYESALALADDLRCYLEGRPIKARPLSSVARSIRWCRQRPMHALALASLVVACVIAVVAWSVTESARREAEASHQRTRQVVDYYLTRISEDELLDQPGMQPLRRDLLDKAREHYQRFVAERRHDVAPREELADAHYRLGLVERLLGKLEAAQREFEAARRIQDELVSSAGGAEQQAALSKSLVALGELHMRRDEFDAAWDDFAQAEQLRHKLVAEHPGQREYGRLLANATMNLAQVAKARGEYDEARMRLQAAEALRRKLLAQSPGSGEAALQGGDTGLRRDLGKGLFNLGGLELDVADAALQAGEAQRAAHLDQAETALRAALDIFRPLAEENRSDLGHQQRLAQCLGLLADALARQQDAGAAAAYDEIVPELERLARENPAVPDYREALAQVCANHARLLIDSGDVALARQMFHEAEQHFELLARLQPRQPRHRESRGRLLMTLAELAGRAGDLAAARECLTTAAEVFTQLAGAAASAEKKAEYEQARDQCVQALGQLDAGE
jgi:tetratricopeptide (TPR) repeat protein/predicted Ser/Thr protein kinase